MGWLFGLCWWRTVAAWRGRPSGFDPQELYQFKSEGRRLKDRPDFIEASLVDALRGTACDLVLEASPVNLRDGEPGLSATRTALECGMNVVLANKGPLVLAFRELQTLAAQKGVGLAYSATVCGALPVINIGPARSLPPIFIYYAASLMLPATLFWRR